VAVLENKIGVGIVVTAPDSFVGTRRAWTSLILVKGFFSGNPHPEVFDGTRPTWSLSAHEDGSDGHRRLRGGVS
jgi:hypothetical protein